MQEYVRSVPTVTLEGASIALAGARARAAENQAWLALCNRAGPADDGTCFCGGSCVIAPDGTVVADAGDAEDAVVVAAVDVAQARRARAAFPVLPLRVPGVDTDAG